MNHLIILKVCQKPHGIIVFEFPIHLIFLNKKPESKSKEIIKENMSVDTNQISPLIRLVLVIII